MNIGSRVRVVNSYNTDLNGKNGSVVGIMGEQIEVVMDNRPNQKYVISAIHTTLLGRPEVVEVPKKVDVPKEMDLSKELDELIERLVEFRKRFHEQLK